MVDKLPALVLTATTTSWIYFHASDSSNLMMKITEPICLAHPCVSFMGW